MRKFIIAAGLAAALITPSSAMAKDATVPYTTVEDSCNGGPSGTIKFSKGVATFTLPDNSAYGVIKTFPTNLKVRDIKTLSFKSMSSLGGGMVYMNVITNTVGINANGNMVNHKIKYTPFAQGSSLTGFLPELGIGSWYSHNMLTSGVRLNDADDSTATMTWADAVSTLGNETVNRVSVTAGCAMNSGTVQLDRIQVNNTVTAF
jgi:hypothetical protein